MVVLHDLETAVARMAKIGACWMPGFSPDGKRIAFISNLSGIPQVWIVPTEGGWPQRVTAIDDQIVGVSWSPDGEWLAFDLAPGGGLNRQIYVIRPDGTDMRLLTQGGKDNNWLGFWTHDGKALSIASCRRTPLAMDAYLVNPASGEWRMVAQNQGIGILTDVSQDGRRAALYRVVSRGSSDLYVINLASGREILLTPHDGPGNFTLAKFSPDGQTVYITSDKDRDLVAFARVRLDAQGQPGPIEVLAGRDDAELQTFDITHDGKTAALIWNVYGRSELAFLDLVTLKSTPGPQLPAEIATGPTFSSDGHLLAFVVSGSTTPMDIWVLDCQSGQLWPVTHSPHPGVRLESLVGPELVRFPAHDGLELSGWLYRPRDFKAPGPVVLSFHGGPEGQERPTFRSDYQALLAQGIAVFAPNVRGSGGFGKTFVNLDNGALRFNGIKDIESCAAYLTRNGIADPKRMGIMGGSYGGYMTMAGLTEYPDLFAAGANLFGVVNFKTFFAHTEPWMAAISKIEYGDPDTQGDLLDSLSPIHKVDRVKAPTIVLHGANDTNVPVIEAEQVVENLQKRGVAVEYVLFPDEGHGFQKEANRITSTVAITRWFVKHLKVD